MNSGCSVPRTRRVIHHAKLAEFGPSVELTSPPPTASHVRQKDSLPPILNVTLAGVLNGRDLVFGTEKVHSEVARVANMARDIQGARPS